MTDEEMVRIANILKRQLRRATPENYAMVHDMVNVLCRHFREWFEEADPDFLPERFYSLIFDEYPVDLYG